MIDNPRKSLRKQAEKKLVEDKKPSEDMSSGELGELVHELRIHQVELELQNEELIRSQEETEKARKTYQDLWDFSPVGYVIIDGSGRIMAINRCARRLLGRSGNTLLDERFSKFVAPDDQVTVHFLLEKMKVGGISERREIGFTRPDGSVCSCLLSCKAVEDQSGGQNVQAVLTDITELQKTQEVLKAVQKDLELRVLERTAALEKQNIEQQRINRQLHAEVERRKQTEETLQLRSRELRNSRDQMEARVRERTADLEAKNQELQEFAHIASHDLQEPLRKIVTFGDILVNDSGDLLDDESRDCIQRMQKSAGIMRELLDSLLSYSRVATKPAPFKKMDLREPIEAALSNLEVTIKEKHALVEVGNLPVIEADPVQMIQIFQNIIANALKFCSEENPPHVRIYSPTPGEDDGRKRNEHRICVEDNGIGFDERHLDKIFSPFQRLHGKIKYQGVGMGLAICKKIVDRHGGEITAKSTVGEGTTFIITLPEREEDRL